MIGAIPTSGAAIDAARAASDSLKSAGAEVTARVRAETLGRVAEIDKEVRGRIDGVKREVAGKIGELTAEVQAVQDEVGNYVRDAQQIAQLVAQGLAFKADLIAQAQNVVSRTMGVHDHVYPEWQHQLRSWQRLYAAADDGRRLPLYDRVFRLRRVVPVGFNVAKIDQLAGSSPLTVPLLSGAQLTSGLGGIVKGLRSTIAVWNILGQLHEPLASLSGAVCPDYRNYYAHDSHGLLFDSRGWCYGLPISESFKIPAALMPYVDDERRFHSPEIPCDLADEIPIIYQGFWLAPEGINDRALLHQLETLVEALKIDDGTPARQASLAAARSAGKRVDDHREPGRGEIHIDWGRLRGMDFTPMFLDPAWVAFEFFGGKVGETILGDDVAMPYELTPEHYNAILGDIVKFRGPEWIAIQQGISIENDSSLLTALDYGRRIIAGDSQALDYVKGPLKDLVTGKLQTEMSAAQLAGLRRLFTNIAMVLGLTE